MKIFLCGQGPAAEKILHFHLTEVNGISNLAIFTHPDATIIDKARELNIHYTIASVNDCALWPFEPDIIVSIYYRTIIKQHVIDRVHGKIFNAHTSLLPRHRGRSPIPWAIVEGDRHTGVTYHYIDAGIDTGKIILQAACQIDSKETQLSLFDKINNLVVAYFPAALTLVKSGFLGVNQRGEALYHYAGPPHNGQINTDWSVCKIERFIRAMTYPPLAPARLGDKPICSMEDYYEAILDRYIQNNVQNQYRISV